MFLAILEDWTRELAYGRGTGSEGGREGGAGSTRQTVAGIIAVCRVF